MHMPAALRLPRLEDCRADLVGDASFWVASMCTSSYGFEARRLEASCEAWGVCCGVARVAEDAASEIAGGATPGLLPRLKPLTSHVLLPTW